MNLKRYQLGETVWTQLGTYGDSARMYECEFMMANEKNLLKMGAKLIGDTLDTVPNNKVL